MQLSFGTKLKAARFKKNISIQALANKMGVSRQIIYTYEKNKSLPQATNLNKLISTLGLAADYFTKVNQVKITKYAATEEILPQVIRRMEKTLVEYINLEQLVAEEYPMLVKHHQFTIDSKATAIKTANELRKLANTGSGAIRNIFPIAEKLGIKIIEENIPRHIKSIAGRYNENGLFIALNRDIAMQDIRITILKGIFDLCCKITNNTIPIKDLFYAFATEFLLPTPILKKYLGTERTYLTFWEITNLSQNYIVPLELLLMQIIDLNILQSADLPAFKERIKANYFGIKHNIIFYYEKHFRIINLLLRAKAENIFQDPKELGDIFWLNNLEEVVL